MAGRFVAARSILVGISLLVFCAGRTSHSQSLPTAAPGRSSSLQDLLESRIAALRTQVGSLDRQIVSLRQRIPEAERQLDELIREAEAVSIPDPQSETEEETEEDPREVPFRPPMLRTVQKGTPLAIVCTNNRAAILDLERYLEMEAQLMSNSSRLRSFLNGGGGKLDAGDFEIQWVIVEERSTGWVVSKELVPKPNRRGESADIAVTESSNLQQRLRQLDAEESVIQFAVYPDSYDVFRAVRAVLWDRKFDINWVPYRHDKTIRISGTQGGVGAQ